MGRGYNSIDRREKPNYTEEKERGRCLLLKIGYCRIVSESGHDAAYAALLALWQEETDRPFPRIACTERGKPYFVDEKLYFSISHTKHHAFCALSDVPVGIDAEEMDRVVNPSLAEKILSPGEYAQYLAARDKNKALLTFWVLKEAEAKCTGEGLRGYPNKTSFSLDDPRVQEMNGCLGAVIKENDGCFLIHTPT